jgi:hypothetical protein
MKIPISSALGITLICAAILSPVTPAYAQEDIPLLPRKPIDQPSTLEELAHAAQNPVSNLTSALMENNFNLGVGPSNGLNFLLNLEEFYPFRLADRFQIVQRFILPIVTQPELGPNQGGQGGLGDIQYQAYFSSINQKGLVFGLGPIASAPTAYPNELGSGKWSIGPTAVIGYVLNTWVAGVLGNELWSVSHYNDRPPVRLMQLQPFIYYNLPNAWYIATSPVITANWKAGISDRWTVPVGGGLGKVFRISKQAIKAEFQGFDAVVSPQTGPDWSIRLQFQFLFPGD